MNLRLQARSPFELMAKRGSPNLMRIASTRLSELNVLQAPPPARQVLWPAERYGLDRSQLFRGLGDEQKNEVLGLLSEWNLKLSLSIELSGMDFAAKMVLLAQTYEEKSLFSLLGQDEVVHRSWLEQFLSKPLDFAGFAHPLVEPLYQVIAEADRAPSLYLIQVLLEGFGIGHYSGLKRSCLSPELSLVLQAILKDEARHHGGGKELLTSCDFTASERDYVTVQTLGFAKGLLEADWVAKALAQVSGGLSRLQRDALDQDLDAEQTKGARLQHIRKLIDESQLNWVWDNIERDLLRSTKSERE